MKRVFERRFASSRRFHLPTKLRFEAMIESNRRRLRRRRLLCARLVMGLKIDSDGIGSLHVGIVNQERSRFR